MSQPTALLSVYNKEGIVEFARELVKLGWKILSSGGTAQALEIADVPVIRVEDITGMPAILGHRVVTLQPAVHGGLLASPAMRPELDKLGYPWIDLLCVDLYPLEEEIAKPDATRESVIDKTDIGGPTLIRSAAKGRRIVICHPEQRAKILSWIKAGRPGEDIALSELAAFAEATVARYCLASARYHNPKWNGVVRFKDDSI